MSMLKRIAYNIHRVPVMEITNGIYIYQVECDGVVSYVTPSNNRELFETVSNSVSVYRTNKSENKPQWQILYKVSTIGNYVYRDDIVDRATVFLGGTPHVYAYLAMDGTLDGIPYTHTEKFVEWVEHDVWREAQWFEHDMNIHVLSPHLWRTVIYDNGQWMPQKYTNTLRDTHFDDYVDMVKKYCDANPQFEPNCVTVCSCAYYLPIVADIPVVEELETDAASIEAIRQRTLVQPIIQRKTQPSRQKKYLGYYTAYLDSIRACRKERDFEYESSLLRELYNI